MLAAGLDAAGNPVVWTHRSVSSSILARFLPQMFHDGKDENAYEGAADIPYAIPNIHVDWIRDEPGVPVGFWRSVGSSHTAWVKESFLDEIAAASHADPLELRRRLLGASHSPSAPRLLGVLNAAAERAGWGTALPAGRARGLAVHESFGSFVAEVAEVSLGGDGHAGRAPGGVRGGLRPGGEPADHRSADAERHRLRAVGRALWSHHH